MTIVNPKSISGINSITTGSGSDNLLTIHTSDASNTERFRIDSTGTTKIVTGIVTTLTATTGIVTTLTTNTLTANSTTKVGSGVTLSPDGDIFATGVCTATTFSGSGASLTNLPAANITGTLPAISGANLTNLDASDLASGTVPTARLGSGTASSSTFLRGDSTFAAVTSTTINNNADNRLITGSGTANTLNGESDLTFNGSKLSLSLAGGSNHIVELVNTSASSNEGTVLKLRASGRGGAEDNADVFLTTNNTDTRVFSVTNAGTVNTTGNIVMASGKGIDFSATGEGVNSSSMSSELLDDYEEGSWTPQIHTQNGNSNASYNYQTGYYTKIGNRVSVNFSIMWSGATNHNGYIYVNNFPYSSANVTHNNNVGTIMTYDLPFSGSRTDVVLYMGSNSTGTNIYFSGNNASWDPGQNATGGRILGSMQYLAT